MEAVRPILERYLASKGRTFAGEVQRKQARLMSVTSPIDRDGPGAAQDPSHDFSRRDGDPPGWQRLA